MSNSVSAARPPSAPTRRHARLAVLVADDDGPREAISAILVRKRFRCTSPPMREATAPSLDPSLAVVWMANPSSRLAECIDPLIQGLPQTPLILVCPSLERWDVRAAMVAGAAGVVLWEDVMATLGPCIDAVLTGQTCVPRQHWRQIAPPVLSSREKQILGLVVMGFTNGQIAQQLFVAESTVKSHLSSAFGKLGVRSRNEAASVILDTDRGLGMGILALGGDPVLPGEADSL